MDTRNYCDIVQIAQLQSAVTGDQKIAAGLPMTELLASQTLQTQLSRKHSIMTKLMKSTLSWLLTAVLVITPFTVAQAGMTDTDQILESPQAQADRDQVRLFIDRETTRQQLLQWGVSADDVKMRINSLTDAEVARINQAISDPQAGGGILGIILVVFIVFVITDVIGATDIFPFIHPVR